MSDLQEQIKQAISTLLSYLNENDLHSFHLRFNGHTNFVKGFTEEDYQEIIKTIDTEKKSKGYVYLIASETGQYKIGVSKKLDKRVNDFGVKLPFKTWLAHSFSSNDCRNAEKVLHERYADKRSHGEWFTLSPEDVSNILSIQDGQL